MNFAELICKSEMNISGRYQFKDKLKEQEIDKLLLKKIIDLNCYPPQYLLAKGS